MKKILLVCSVVLFQVVAFSQTKWKLDPNHASVKFVVTHMVISEVEGSFKKFDGTFTNTKPDLTDAVINFTVDVASVDTDNDKRDAELKGDGFFDAVKYPQMTFQSTAFNKLSDNKYELLGNLTIRDVTRPVKFDVTYGGSVVNRGTTKVGFKATSTINRFDYGLKWNNLTDAGGAVVSKEVTIDLRLEFSQQK